MSSALIEALKKTPAVAGDLKTGVYVIPTERDNIYGEQPAMVELRKKGYVGRVTHCPEHGAGCNVTFTRSDVAPPTTYAYGKVSLRVCPEAEALKILATMEKLALEALEEGVKRFRDIIANKRLPIKDRTEYDIGKRQYLNTTANYIKVYSRLSETKEGDGRGQDYMGAVCCSLTKNPQNNLVFVPRDWLTYYGYSVIDLRMWLKFLAACGTGFRGHYLGESIMSKEFQAIQDSVPKFGNNNQYMLRDMPCYKVMLETTGANMTNYLNFILVRYMYNMQYWTIPTIALQLKKGLGKGITPWEALLIAHMNQDYYAYYALTNNNGINIAVPSEENSAAEVVRKAASGVMNTAFIYTVENDIVNIRKAIRATDYETIAGHLKRWRKK